MIALVRIVRLELDGLLTPEPEGLLQLEAHPDVVVLDPIERRAVDLSRLRVRADEYTIGDPVVVVLPGDDVLSIHLLRPPAQYRHPVLDGPDGERLRLPPGHRHHWVYRGQIIPTNRNVAVEAQVTRIVDGPSPVVVADGLLSVDGLPIYKMTDFALALVPALETVEP